MDTPLFDGKLVHSSRIIYTPSPFARASLLHLQEVGSLQARQPHDSARKDLSSYLFFLVEHGSGLLEYEGVCHTLNAGDCVFLDCRKPYLHRTGKDLWTLRWAHFFGPNMGAIYKKYQERGGQPVFRPRSPEHFAQLLQELYRLASSDDYVRDMQIYGKLVELLTLLMKRAGTPERPVSPMARSRICRKSKNILTHISRKKSHWIIFPKNFISTNSI